MDTIALLSHNSPDAVVAYRAGVPITAQRFLSDAEHLARILPASAHVLNVCADRYHFTVGFAACLMTGRVSLLPSTHTSEVIGQLMRFAPDAFCLTDDRHCDVVTLFDERASSPWYSDWRVGFPSDSETAGQIAAWRRRRAEAWDEQRRAELRMLLSSIDAI